MNGFVNSIAQLVRVGQRIHTRKWSFLGIFCIAFFGSVSVLAHFDLLPETPKQSNTSSVTLLANPNIATNVSVPVEIDRVELPMSISISAIQLSSTIANPETTNIEMLDKLLLKGAVRYPTSAKLGETGNIVLFGHSSYLPIVNNQAYKTFNGIQKLVAGDVIIVSSSGTSYTYRVRTVAKESTTDAGIPLSVTGQVLTLATCDSFGAKTDRFVVTADFVESHSIST